MKTDRLLARAAAVVLAGLLLAADLHAAGHTLQIGRLTLSFASPTKKLAEALAPKVEAVQQTFDASRRVLPPVPPGGKPSYSRDDVALLISHTGDDLDKAIESVRPAEMWPLRDWAAEEIRRIQGELVGLPGQTADSLPGFSTPRAVAVVASLGRLPLGLASVTATAPQQDTVPAAVSDRLLDEVGNVISRIFFLASHDDLEVKIWVGSTVPHATFSFWSQGQVKGSTPASMIIRTDGTRTVLRGLYAYRATHTDGAVTELVQYPNPVGASAAQTPSERLDLVNGSSFFCCRFDESYCQHVAGEKECRP